MDPEQKRRIDLAIKRGFSSTLDVVIPVWLVTGPPAGLMILWWLFTERPEFWPYYVALTFALTCYWQGVILFAVIYDEVYRWQKRRRNTASGGTNRSASTRNG